MFPINSGSFNIALNPIFLYPNTAALLVVTKQFVIGGIYEYPELL